MSALVVTLVADGPSDECLVSVLTWLLDRHLPDRPFRIQFAYDGLPPLRDGLRARVFKAVELYPCNLLVVHRDAEAAKYEDRMQEIDRECRGLATRFLCLVPVRMVEAWLLFDEGAIRKAAGNPNGTTWLGIPALSQHERLPDPKGTFFSAIQAATELGPRRRQNVMRGLVRQRVAELITDFSPLRAFRAFHEFEAQLTGALEETSN